MDGPSRESRGWYGCRGRSSLGGRLAAVDRPDDDVRTVDGRDREVCDVFDLPIVDLMEEGCFREEIWGIAETDRSIYFFELDGTTRLKCRSATATRGARWSVTTTDVVVLALHRRPDVALALHLRLHRGRSARPTGEPSDLHVAGGP